MDTPVSTAKPLMSGPRPKAPSGKAAVTYRVVESAPPRRLVTRIADQNLPYGGSWTYDLTPDGSGTHLTITEHGEVYNPIFRFVSRFIMGHTSMMDGVLRALGTRHGETVVPEPAGNTT